MGEYNEIIHNFTKKTELVDAENCYYYITESCDDCGKVSSEYYDNLHNFTKKTELVDAENCYYYITESCDDCGKVFGEYYDNLHSIVTEEKFPTCSQFGFYKEYCKDCDMSIQENELWPTVHKPSSEDGDNSCLNCGHSDIRYANGAVILEDCSGIDNDEDTYIVGYHLMDYDNNNQNYEELYMVSVSLVTYTDGVENEPIVLSIPFGGYDGGNYIVFSKKEIQALAEENKVSDYELRCSFIPLEGDLTNYITL